MSVALWICASALYAYARIKEQLPNDPALNEALRQIRRQAGC